MRTLRRPRTRARTQLPTGGSITHTAAARSGWELALGGRAGPLPNKETAGRQQRRKWGEIWISAAANQHTGAPWPVTVAPASASSALGWLNPAISPRTLDPDWATRALEKSRSPCASSPSQRDQQGPPSRSMQNASSTWVLSDVRSKSGRNQRPSTRRLPCQRGARCERLPAPLAGRIEPAGPLQVPTPPRPARQDGIEGGGPGRQGAGPSPAPVCTTPYAQHPSVAVASGRKPSSPTTW